MIETHDQSKHLTPKLEDAYKQIKRLLEEANGILPAGMERHGGYLTILDAKTGQILVVLACGTMSAENREKYLHFSQEKALRLFLNVDHKTSFESRDVENLKFAGAIRGEEFIYSFSGHQEDVDEAIAVSMFYIFEPSEDNRMWFRGKELIDYYYDVVSDRNKLIHNFLFLTRRYNENIWMDSYFPR